MGKADLHAHSRHDDWGDGNATVVELLRYVEENTDLDIFGITDHDSIDAARAALAIHREGNFRFAFLPGVEVTNLAGHLLCYFPSGDIVDIPSLRPFWWTVEYAHAHGAICVAAHPVYPPWLLSTILRGLNRGRILDGLETVNAGISASAQERLTSVTRPFEHRLACVANSDAHEASTIGAAFTTFPGANIVDFVQALGARQTQPVFVDRPQMTEEGKRFTTRRSMMRPGWARNLWREARPPRRQ